MIPWLMIAVGGVMILSGVKDTNPIEVIKSILGGGGVPDGSFKATGADGQPKIITPGTPESPTVDAPGNANIADKNRAEGKGNTPKQDGWTSGGGGSF